MTDCIVQVRKVRPVKLSSAKPADFEMTGPPLTYRYGSPLRVGDRVMCPGNEYSGPFQAEVTALGSDYDGHVRSLLCRVAPDRKRR